MPSASDYVNELVAQGKYHFTTEEAVAALGESISRVRAGLRRLNARGELVDPHRSFHVILPPDHRPFGCPPPPEFVPPLMQHLDEPYYVALLSAAEFYGAVRDQDVFQVMARLNRKPIDCGRSRVEFVARKDLDRTPVLDEPLRGRPLDKPWLEKAAANGGLRVASPEATAIELVGYADRCGGLERIADVLSELIDSLDPERLAAVAPLSPIVWTQRLGYLLDITEHRGLANVLVPGAKDFKSVRTARPSLS